MLVGRRNESVRQSLAVYARELHAESADKAAKTKKRKVRCPGEVFESVLTRFNAGRGTSEGFLCRIQTATNEENQKD
jgi:hypothetical protein